MSQCSMAPRALQLLPLPPHHSHERHNDESQRQSERVSGRPPGPAHSPATVNQTETDEHRTRDTAKALSALERGRRADGAGARLLAGDGRPRIPGGKNSGQHAAPSCLDDRLLSTLKLSEQSILERGYALVLDDAGQLRQSQDASSG